MHPWETGHGITSSGTLGVRVGRPATSFSGSCRILRQYACTRRVTRGLCSLYCSKLGWEHQLPQSIFDACAFRHQHREGEEPHANEERRIWLARMQRHVYAWHRFGKSTMGLPNIISLREQGDPFADSVILWTRASPTMENDASNVTVEGLVPYFSHETEKYIKASTSPICVDWKVSKSSDMSGIFSSNGRAYTTSDIDYTIKVRAIGPRMLLVSQCLRSRRVA